MADGSAETAGYELGILLQASSTNHSQNKQMLSLWLSPAMRQRFRDSSAQSLLPAQFDAVGIATIEADPADYLRNLQLPPATEVCDEALRQAVLAYLQNQDIVRLWAIRQQWPSWHLVRLFDPASGQSFLSARPDAPQLPALFNLSGALDPQRRVVLPALNATEVRDFVRSRAVCLEILQDGSQTP